MFIKTKGKKQNKNLFPFFIYIIPLLSGLFRSKCWVCAPKWSIFRSVHAVLCHGMACHSMTSHTMNWCSRSGHCTHSLYFVEKREKYPSFLFTHIYCIHTVPCMSVKDLHILMMLRRRAYIWYFFLIFASFSIWKKNIQNRNLSIFIH